MLTNNTFTYKAKEGRSTKEKGSDKFPFAVSNLARLATTKRVPLLLKFHNSLPIKQQK